MGCASSTPAQARPPARQPRLGAANAGGTPHTSRLTGPPPRVKLVLLGESGVGKSCIMVRYVRGQFDPASKITIGAAFMSHNVSLPDGKSIKFEIWDTAGQERYLSLAPLYYRGAHAAAVVFDITSEASFEKAQYWIRELQKNASDAIVLILVGNKSDLEEQREVTTEDARAFADANGMMFVETSAKTAANVSDVFSSVAAKLLGGLPTSSHAAVVH